MDTLGILDYEDGILGTYQIEDRSKLQFHIQNTGGEPNVPNHDWSEHYQRWLSNRESVYVNNLNDYYLESDCVRGYDNNWIFKDNSIYSDYYKSYIDKDNAVNLEGFGLVDSDDIITVYDDIDTKFGRPFGPKKFLRSKLDNSNYLKVEIGYDDYWVNSKLCLYDTYNSNNIIKTDRFENEYTTLYLIDSVEFNQSDRIFSDLIDNFSVYYHSWGIDDKYTKFPIFLSCYDSKQISRKKYCTKETLEYFNFEIGDRPVVYMQDEDYYKGYHKMCYQYSVDIIKKYMDSIEGCNAEPLLKNLKEIGDYLYSNNVGSYRDINDSYNGVKKYGSYTSYFNSVVSKLYKDNLVIEKVLSDESLDQLFSDIRDSSRNFTFEDLDGKEISVSWQDDDNDILKDKLRKFIKTFEDSILYFSYWYIVFNDSDYAGYRLESYLTKNSIDLNTRNRGLICNYVRYNDVGGLFSRSINIIRREVDRYDSLVKSVLDENNIDRYRDENEKSIEVYNNFLTFLK
jgi:hypothetical protein